MNKLVLIVAAVSLFWCGCTTPWSKATGGSLDVAHRYGFKVNSPINDWYQKQVHKTMLFTKRGMALESIVIDPVRWDDTLVNGCPIPKMLLLHELPEIVLGELEATSQAHNIQIQSNAITHVDSFPCALTKFTFTEPNGLRKKGIMYCFPMKKHFTVLRYTAERSHYFELTYRDFLDMISTIEIQKRKYLALPGVHIPGQRRVHTVNK